MDIYTRYAEVYDQSGQIHFTLRMIPYLNELLQRHNLAIESCLDLACGSGTLAIALAAKGWQVYAIDASPAMLTEAKRKAAEAGVEVEFSKQDMRHFSLSTTVDLVTCFYDSLNYLLTVADLEKTFRRVAAALKDGGAFIFDLNTLYALESLWDNGTEFRDYGDLAVTLQCQYVPQMKRATVVITGFVRRGELYERFVETHVEQAYGNAQIARSLQRAGLEVTTKYHCFTFEPPTRRSGKVAWLARKVGT